MAVVLFASACGGSSTTVAAPETDEPTATGLVESPTPTAAPTPTPAPTEEPARLEPAASSVATVLSEAPRADGWIVPAGEWSTTAFDVPARFRTDSDMLLIRESQGALWLRAVGTERTSMLAIATSAFVNSGGPEAPQRPAPRTPEDITMALEDGTFSVLLDQGVATVDQRDVHWWDFMLDDTVGNSPWLCREGATCLMTGQSVGGERLIVPTSQRLRVYVPFIDDELRIGVWVIADNDADFDALVGLAEDMVADFEPESGRVTPTQVRSITVDGVETTTLPAGHTVALIGEATVEIELQGNLPTVGLDAADETALIFSTTSGYVAFFEPSAVYPAEIDVQAAEQAAWRAWDLIELDNIEDFTRGRVARWQSTPVASMRRSPASTRRGWTSP